VSSNTPSRMRILRDSSPKQMMVKQALIGKEVESTPSVEKQFMGIGAENGDSPHPYF
jgi:hypothetical protein